MRFSNSQLYQMERYEAAMIAADRNQSLEQWAKVLRERKHEQSAADVILSSMVELLAPVLCYLAAAKTAQAASIRVWCVLYAVRPDLVDHETFQDAADRHGVSQPAVIYHFAKLKAAIPSFAFRDRHVPRMDKLKARVLKANAVRIEQQKAAKAKKWAARSETVLS
ncbi:MAG: hypothetical protein RL376_810 [Verrucomicrobiota bacterium]|jgi:hypothetical protein